MLADVETLLRPSVSWEAVGALNDAQFDLWCDQHCERLEALFFEAQALARQHPEWFEREGISEHQKAAITIIRDLPEYPGGLRGPDLADDFIRWVHANLSEQEWERDMDQLFVDSKLAGQALGNQVRRNLMGFDDFQRLARTGLPDPGNPDNVRIFLRMQRLELRWNDWWQRVEIARADSGNWSAVDDTVVGRLMTQAGDTQYQFRPADALFRRALETMARENPFDPVIEHLAALQAKWDGKPRLLTWLTIACGVPCDPYHQAVGRNLIGGMVKRARQPGCKHDEVVIFIGPQGTYKSTLCRILATRPEFFTDSIAFDGSPQNVVPQLFAKWIIELAELDGMANRETTFLKRFISAQSDNVTLKYKAMASDYARRCVFIGTSNDDKVLRDATGNRRFLPVRIERAIDVAWVRENLDQLLAEAAVFEHLGADFSIPDQVTAAARVHQEAARAEADFETYLEGWFEGDTPTLVSSADVASLLREAVGKSIPANRFGSAMRRLGFEETRTYIMKKRTRVWLRGVEQDAQRIVLSRDSATGRLTPRNGGPVGQVLAPGVPPPCPASRS